MHEKAFGRRRSAPLVITPASRADERRLPSLKDIGFTPSDDHAELRAFKEGYRRRRFISRGGWRWVGGVCLGLGGLIGALNLSPLDLLFYAAGGVALAYGFLRSAHRPLDPGDDARPPS